MPEKKKTADVPQIVVHARKSLSITVYDTKWMPSSNKFVVLGNHAKGTGSIHVLELNRGEINTVTEASKHSAFKCGTFGASFIEERFFATGDFDGRVALWNLDRLDLPIWTTRKHENIINSIDGIGGILGGGAPEIVTGSRDGKVYVWDPRTKEPVASIIPEPHQTSRDCWAVAFGNSVNEDRIITAGYDNGELKMFDLRANKMKWESKVSHGICSMEFDRKDIDMNKLLVTTLEGQFHVYDLRTFNEKAGFATLSTQAHESTVWCGRHLPQNRDVWMTTGGDGNVNLYRYTYPTDRIRKDTKTEELFGVVGSVDLLKSENLSTQPILSFDWNTNKEGLCVFGSLDQSVRVGIVTKTKLL